MALGKDDYEDDESGWYSEKRGWDFEWVGLKPVASLTRCNRILGDMDFIPGFMSGNRTYLLGLREIISIARNAELYLPTLERDVRLIKKEVPVAYELPEAHARGYSMLNYVLGNVLFDNDRMNGLLTRLKMDSDITYKSRRADRVPQLVKLLHVVKLGCERENLLVHRGEIIRRIQFLEVLVKNHSGLKVA